MKMARLKPELHRETRLKQNLEKGRQGGKGTSTERAPQGRRVVINTRRSRIS